MSVHYYISGHGLGHAARAAQVMAALAPEIPVVAHTQVAADFLFQESGRTAQNLAVVGPGPEGFWWDAAPVQRGPREIDWRETEARFAQMLVRMDGACDGAPRDARLMISDVAPWPLAAGPAAGVPAFLVANFTWADILGAAAEAGHGEGLAALTDRMRTYYGRANALFRPPMSFAMEYAGARQVPIEAIGRRGVGRSDELRRAAHAPAGARLLVLCYFGVWSDAAFSQACEHAVRAGVQAGIHYFGLGLSAPPGVARLAGPDWPFADVLASCDAVLAKPGYGTFADAMANATPIAFHPRPEFGEYPVLRRHAMEWGGGVEIGEDDFAAGNWTDAVERAAQLRPKPQSSRGAQHIADAVANAWQARG